MTEQETTAQFYQPTDADGNPIGLPIEYTDEKDLQQKLTAATQRMKFVVSRDKTKAPDSAPRFQGEGPSEDHIKRDVATFLQETPGYYSCPANFQAIVGWIDQNNLNPELSTFKLAFEVLSKNGLLLDAKGNPMSAADTTGISYTTKSGKVLYGRAAIDAMPADEYKRRLNAEHGFADRVERVLASK
jgi:hypothetical protein